MERHIANLAKSYRGRPLSISAFGVGASFAEIFYRPGHQRIVRSCIILTHYSALQHYTGCLKVPTFYGEIQAEGERYLAEMLVSCSKATYGNELQHIACATAPPTGPLAGLLDDVSLIVEPRAFMLHPKRESYALESPSGTALHQLRRAKDKAIVSAAIQFVLGNWDYIPQGFTVEEVTRVMSGDFDEILD